MLKTLLTRCNDLGNVKDLRVLYNSDVIYQGNVKDLIEFFIIVMLYMRVMLKI
jgi:hypothetical protein